MSEDKVEYFSHLGFMLIFQSYTLSTMNYKGFIRRKDHKNWPKGNKPTREEIIF